MTDAELGAIVHETYAAHCILTNLGFEPDEVFVEVRPVANTRPPGPHVVVRLARGELTFVYHLHPVTPEETERFSRAWLAFVAAQPSMPRADLDRILHSSQVWEQRATLLTALLETPQPCGQIASSTRDH